MFSKKARAKGHSPAARRKAVATMRRNRTGIFKPRVSEIPLAAVPARPVRRKPKSKRKPVTLAELGENIESAKKLALEIAELLS